MYVDTVVLQLLRSSSSPSPHHVNFFACLRKDVLRSSWLTLEPWMTWIPYQRKRGEHWAEVTNHYLHSDLIFGKGCNWGREFRLFVSNTKINIFAILWLFSNSNIMRIFQAVSFHVCKTGTRCRGKFFYLSWRSPMKQLSLLITKDILFSCT